MKNGIAAGAAVAYDEEGNEIASAGKFLRNVTTPIAEYTALTVGLGLARTLGATHVYAFGDAELIVRQVDGRYRCKDQRLAAMRDMVHLLAHDFEECKIMELPKAGPKNKRRHLNQRADELAAKCRDAGHDFEEVMSMLPRTGSPIPAEGTLPAPG